MKCQQIKSDGQPCGAFAMTGSECCYLHNPAIPSEEKRLAQIQGGANRALTIAEPLPAMSLETPTDAVLLLADTINRVRAGQLDVRIANCIGVLSGHLLKALEIAQLKDKIDIIDTLILTKRANRH